MPEVGRHALERVERDPSVRRELPTGDAEHPARAREKTVSRRAVAVLPSPTGSTRSPAKTARTALGAARSASGRASRASRSTCSTSSGGRSDRRGIAVVRGVGRAEEQHVVPGHGERDAHVVLRERQRGRPSPRRRGPARATPLLSCTDVPARGSSSARTWSTHGPAALTTTRASTDDRARRRPRPPRRRPARSRCAARRRGARLSTTAPASAAAITFSRHSRASFVQASA